MTEPRNDDLTDAPEAAAPESEAAAEAAPDLTDAQLAAANDAAEAEVEEAGAGGDTLDESEDIDEELDEGGSADADEDADEADDEVDPLEPVVAKGKAEPIRVWRATNARSRVGQPEKPTGTPFGGRSPQ